MANFWSGTPRQAGSPSRGCSAAAARARSAPGLAGRWPAYFVAFDVLQMDRVELLARPYRERRARLEDLFTGHGLSAPWTLVPMTTDPAITREWLESWTDVSGVEGVVAKGMNQPYSPPYAAGPRSAAATPPKPSSAPSPSPARSS
ncbi:hypothetical protein [Streptomyces sp. R33]|uniref:ATP-dependent DNA ligase family profile domain-containing protein n=1 Tax=Streptomyces sp. R33 TaxID=3238629 RepID=A0AB39XWI8_9ACTN